MIISKEDLLLRIVKLKAENSLLRNKLVECGKDKALISELEFKLNTATDDRVNVLRERIEKMMETIRNQRQELKRLNGN